MSVVTAVRPWPEVAVAFRPERVCDSSQREILEVRRTLEFPSGENNWVKYFPPLHSLVKFHSGLTKINPKNYHFPSDVSTVLAPCL